MDEELYEKFINGDKNAFDELYLRYKNRLQYFIFCMVRDTEKAEDIVQEVFAEILTKKYSPEKCSFKYYIFLLAKRKTLNYINTKNRREKIDEKYLSNYEEVENDLLEEIISNENKEKSKYKNINNSIIKK